MLRKLFIAFLLFNNTAFAKKLIPYQVQDYHHWDNTKLWGYKDEDFNVVIQPVNEEPALFVHGYAVLKKNNKYGLIDDKGKIVVQPQYAYCSNAEGNFVAVQDAGLGNVTYVISIKTQEKYGYTESQFGTATALSGYPGLFIVQQSNFGNAASMGLINDKGIVILPYKYASIFQIARGIANEDKELSSNAIFAVEDFSSHLVGMMESDGKWTVKPKYNSIGMFQGGLAKVSLNKKYGYIDISGTEIIPLQYDDASDFPDMTDYFENHFITYAEVTKGNESFFIDDKGNTIFKGKGLKKAISALQEAFIFRDRNDSVYITDKNLKALVNGGANNVVTTDGKNFLLQLGQKAYALNNRAIEEFPLPPVVNIAVFSVGLYAITTKNATGQYAYTITDGNFKPLINQATTFTYQVDEGLDRLGIYFTVKETGNNVLLTYINNLGREYSEISR